MKIAFNRQTRRTPWGGGAHFATAFEDFLTRQGHDVVHKLEPDLDWIVMLDPRHEEGGFAVGDIYRYKMTNPGVKVLHRINDTGVTRGGLELDSIILGSNKVVADKTVFISSWVRDHFVGRGFDIAKAHQVITNGCDTNYFHPPKNLGFPHSPLRVVTHHWSDNPAKGLDVYRYLDENFSKLDIEFTYIGRYPKSYVPRNTTVIAPLYGEALGDELRRHDVYVTGARYEACGSHHVEGAACGMPVVFHREGGGVVEMCSRYGVGINSVNELDEAIETVRNSYLTLVKRAIQTDLSAETMCRKYLELMED